LVRLRMGPTRSIEGVARPRSERWAGLGLQGSQPAGIASFSGPLILANVRSRRAGSPTHFIKGRRPSHSFPWARQAAAEGRAAGFTAHIEAARWHLAGSVREKPLFFFFRASERAESLRLLSAERGCSVGRANVSEVAGKHKNKSSVNLSAVALGPGPNGFAELDLRCRCFIRSGRFAERFFRAPRSGGPLLARLPLNRDAKTVCLSKSGVDVHLTQQRLFDG